MDPVFHQHQLCRIQSGQNTVPSEVRQALDQFICLPQPLAVIDPSREALRLSRPGQAQALVMAHHLKQRSPALPLLSGPSVTPPSVDDLNRDLDLLIGGTQIDPAEVPSGVQSVPLHFVGKRTGIADKISALQIRRGRREKRAGHSDLQLRISPTASADRDPVFRILCVSRRASDLKDLRTDILYVRQKLHRVFSACGDQELLHVLFIAGILGQSAIQHFLLAGHE